MFVEDARVLQDAKELFDNLNSRCSDNIANVTDMPLVREQNVSLTGVDTVTQIPTADLNYYMNHATDISFPLPIKVPAYDERMLDDGQHFTKSNLNVCYAAPRSARKIGIGMKRSLQCQRPFDVSAMELPRWAIR